MKRRSVRPASRPRVLGPNRSTSLKVLVTCGPTREPLDPVRFISNRSTGTLGFEIARAFAGCGHEVVLAAGPVELPVDLDRAQKTGSVRVVRFETARELHGIAVKEFRTCDAVCMTAAVADFRPAVVQAAKIKRGKGALTVRLIPNPDILADLGRRKKPGQILVGFSVESGNLTARAKDKLRRKNLDFLAAQKVGAGNNPFGSVRMDTVFLSRTGQAEAIRGAAKRDLAARIVRAVQALARAH